MRSLTVILGGLTVATACPAQTPNWTQINSTTSPAARTYITMAYDAARQRSVLFGGGAFLADTWEWDGKNWAEIKPANVPTGRRLPGMAFDIQRKRTVMFGGEYRNGILADTWEWDGTNWKQFNLAGSPSARTASALAYDSTRQRTVLFGGSTNNSTATLADTWEWDGRNWTRITTGTSAPSRGWGGMAYDILRRRTVLFGGYGSRGSALFDTWEYDGKNWIQMRPTTSPPPRYNVDMAYDSVRRRTVMFGGQNGLTRFNDTWEWDGKNWTQVTTTNSPSDRYGAGIVFDSVRQRTVLFGGADQSGTLTDTWEYGVAKLTLTVNTPTISIVNGGTQRLTLNAGTGLARKSYWIFGSMTGTMPGVVLTGIHIPLRVDPYTDLTISFANGKEFKHFKRTLSATGTATASLIVPKMLSIPTGFKLYHAYVVYDGTTGQIFTSSNPVSVEFR